MRGWNTFAGSYVAQGNFDELKRARLLCHAQSQRAAVIHQTSYVQSALAYHGSGADRADLRERQPDIHQ